MLPLQLHSVLWLNLSDPWSVYRGEGDLFHLPMERLLLVSTIVISWCHRSIDAPSTWLLSYAGNAVRYLLTVLKNLQYADGNLLHLCPLAVVGRPPSSVAAAMLLDQAVFIATAGNKPFAYKICWWGCRNLLCCSLQGFEQHPGLPPPRAPPSFISLRRQWSAWSCAIQIQSTNLPLVFSMHKC